MPKPHHSRQRAPPSSQMRASQTDNAAVRMQLSGAPHAAPRALLHPFIAALAGEAARRDHAASQTPSTHQTGDLP